MKVVFLSRHQKNIERGAEVFVKELTERLSKKNHVDIFSGQKADSIKSILNGKYDIVIPVNGRFQSLKMSLGRLIGKYKLLITGHSGRGWDDILNIAVAKPDVFVALTDILASWAKKYAWGTEVEKIPNGIDLKKFSPKGERIELDLPRPIILSVGALVWYKHHERIIDAAAKINASLLIVGEGPLKESLEKEGRIKLGDRFMIKSYKNADMPKVYRSVDLFTLPSWDREAFGIVYLEAMASGLGVVAPDDLSRKEIIGDAGVLVNTADIFAYSQALEKALAFDWKNKPRQQAEKFSWDEVARKYENVMTKMLKK